MKPVAYAMFRDGQFYDAIHPDEYIKTAGEYDIPLYTYPVKELTDDDIAKVVHELNQKSNTPDRWVTAMQIGAETIIQLRNELAILRKAQENG
jgi:hypothetical protein